MKNVKRTFFLTEEEVKEQIKITGNRLIDHLSPHYELEDGTILYGLVTGVTDTERFHDFK